MSTSQPGGQPDGSRLPDRRDGVVDHPDAAPDPTATLLTALTRLWPGSRVELVRARRADPTASAEFLVLPHSRRPRLLLPTHGRAASGSVLRLSATAGPTEAAARTVAATALRLGATRALGERVRVYADPTAEGDSLADELARVLDRRHLSFSLGVGPARVNRKPVLQLFGEDGRSVGFAKLGDSETAAADVRAEGDALARLAEHSFTAFRPPRLLHLDTWHELVVLVQEDLAVGPGALLRGRPDAPLAAMAELTEAFAEPDAALADLPWWQRCRERAASTPDPALAERYDALLERTAAACPTPVPVGAWHGDWTPWNMAPARVPLVWDWERFETGVPQGLDPLHYAVNAATLAHGGEPEVVVSALERAGGRHPAGSVGHAVAAGYLVAIAARYLGMAAAPGGGLIVPRALTMLEALERWVSPSGR